LETQDAVDKDGRKFIASFGLSFAVAAAVVLVIKLDLEVKKLGTGVGTGVGMKVGIEGAWEEDEGGRWNESRTYDSYIGRCSPIEVEIMDIRTLARKSVGKKAFSAVDSD
jgi:hypothetical protein